MGEEVAWYTCGRIYFVHRSCSVSDVSGVESASLLMTFRRRADGGSSWVVMDERKYRQFGRFLQLFGTKKSVTGIKATIIICHTFAHSIVL